MKFYIVGGAVRDALLDKIPHDYDIVVEGATPEEMINLGFIPVGKSFPVFLHPVTKMEFALCRKEIKTGAKHIDFEFIWKDVTLEEDLERRDFTINALACQCYVDIATGQITPITDNQEKTIKNCYIIDLHDGFTDLRNGIIRAVNPIHFIEDPLRILRACRFASQLGFRIHSSTMSLLQRMVNDNMLESLSRERIDNETIKAMAPGSHSEIYFIEISGCGALKVLYPEIESLFHNAENINYHSTGNTGLHTLAALRYAYNCDTHVKFGILYHDIYKSIAYTSPERERHDTDKAIAYFDKVTANKRYSYKIRKSCEIAIKYHMKMWTLFDGLSVKKFIDIIDEITNGFNVSYKYLLEDLLKVCAADDNSDKTDLCVKRGQTIVRCKLLQEYALDVFDICSNIKYRHIPNYQELEPSKVKEKLRIARISVVKKYFKNKGDINDKMV